ncbi:MAG: PEP/pyruvate-binding domain-containing protein [Longimicrobiales bacterium]|nr:PEP/pyruvate-binding domain-containing protein [Longimicrobiales bacterium]
MEIPRFGRDFFSSGEVASRIGGGALGGKAEGLVRIRDALTERFARRPLRDAEVAIPRMAVVATDAFDRLMERGNLYDVALSDLPDERIAHAFQKADLPTEPVGDLRALVEEARTPLAVRSPSLLEDALAHPFAGVYETKMVPNNNPDPPCASAGWWRPSSSSTRPRSSGPPARTGARSAPPTVTRRWRS